MLKHSCALILVVFGLVACGASTPVLVALNIPVVPGPMGSGWLCEDRGDLADICYRTKEACNAATNTNGANISSCSPPPGPAECMTYKKDGANHAMCFNVKLKCELWGKLQAKKGATEISGCYGIN